MDLLDRLREHPPVYVAAGYDHPRMYDLQEIAVFLVENLGRGRPLDWWQADRGRSPIRPSEPPRPVYFLSAEAEAAAWRLVAAVAQGIPLPHPWLQGLDWLDGVDPWS